MAKTNNALNNNSKTGVASSTQSFVVSNSDNTGTSAAQVQISVGGATTTGDAQDSFIVTGVTTWSMGCDNSDSDSLVICPSATLGTTNSHVITTSGYNRWPLQPAALGMMSPTQLNKTGNGSTPYNVTPYVEAFDKGSNLGVTNFTAPVAGKYLFIGAATITDCAASTSLQIQFVSTNKTFVKTPLRTASAADNSSNMNAVGTMAAADTVFLKISGLGEASNRNDVVGGTATVVTYFAVYKLS